MNLQCCVRPMWDKRDWQDELGEIADRLEETCRNADSYSTDQWLDESRTKTEG